MQTWQERMNLKLEQVLRPTMEALAEGGCVDEGEKSTDWEGLHPTLLRGAQDREARIEYSREARLWLLERPSAGLPEEVSNLMRGLARHPSPVVRQIAADLYGSNLNIPGEVTTVPDLVGREVSTREFMQAAQVGIANLARKGVSRADAESEWLSCRAEEESGVSRNVCLDGGGEKSSARISYEKTRNRLYMRLYRNS